VNAKKYSRAGFQVQPSTMFWWRSNLL